MVSLYGGEEGIRTLKFGVNGVFIIKSSIYAAFRGRIFFLSVGLKNE